MTGVVAVGGNALPVVLAAFPPSLHGQTRGDRGKDLKSSERDSRLIFPSSSHARLGADDGGSAQTSADTNTSSTAHFARTCDVIKCPWSIREHQ